MVNAQGDCGDPSVATVRGGAPYSFLHVQQLTLSTNVTSESVFSFCLTVEAGRRVDWYLVPKAAADVWAIQAQFYYASNPNTAFQVEPAPVVAKNKQTAGFRNFVQVLPAEVIRAASGNFLVVVHATQECFDANATTPGCTATSAVKPSSIVLDASNIYLVVILAVVAAALLVSTCVVIACCCLRHSRGPKEANTPHA